MEIKLSKLINSSILNDEWVGFLGDSEYTDSNGELVFGYWHFKEIVGKELSKDMNEDEWVFDVEDKIDINTSKSIIFIRNSNNNICLVKLMYDI